MRTGKKQLKLIWSPMFTPLET